MSAEAKLRKKVLFVDDSSEFLDIFTQAMQIQSKGEWEILTAINAGKALSILQEHQINLVVIDVQMPLVDGLQLLKLIGMKHPNLPRVVLTGFPNPADRATSLANGADLYLEKPTSPEGVETIFSTLNELAKVEPEIGFQGTLRRVGLHDILQMECLGRNSAVLEVFNKDTRGEIFIKDGSVIHAQANQLTGQPAFFFLLSISGGGFKLKPFVAPPEISITKSWEFLLMESARRRDETDILGRNGSSEEPDEAAIENASKAAAQAATIKIPKIKFPTRKNEPVQIREMAVFSGQGDVLYEFQCPDVELRKRILQFVTEKSKQMGEGLKLGRFDLIEMQNARSRMVTQIQEDAGIYLSAYKTVSASPAEAV
jgi:CheY-like chemotaxis protein